MGIKLTLGEVSILADVADEEKISIFKYIIYIPNMNHLTT